MRTSTEEAWKHLVFAGILSVFGTRCCFIFHQFPICLCHSFISGTCRERIFSIFPIFTRWINTSRFDFKSQHQQFVMRWAIISVHVISFNSAYNIPNSWRTHSHPYCCCLHAFFLVAVLFFLLHLVRSIDIDAWTHVSQWNAIKLDILILLWPHDVSSIRFAVFVTYSTDK